MCLIKLQVQERFLAPIIVYTILIIFYKTTGNTRLAFNFVTTEYFDPFYIEMLVFLFENIYSSMSE